MGRVTPTRGGPSGRAPRRAATRSPQQVAGPGAAPADGVEQEGGQPLALQGGVAGALAGDDGGQGELKSKRAETGLKCWELKFESRQTRTLS